ncbi:hypothetical protein RM96_29470 [Cupriavidus sp. IDO]|nr:hypothetical protein RM96_29470 [Cupriavidus sp. IDO]
MDIPITLPPIADTLIILGITMAGLHSLAPCSSGASITGGTTGFITDSMTVASVWGPAPVRARTLAAVPVWVLVAVKALPMVAAVRVRFLAVVRL